jgi:hypothetical protein
MIEANFSYCGKCGRGYLIFLKNNKWKIYKLKILGFRKNTIVTAVCRNCENFCKIHKFLS